MAVYLVDIDGTIADNTHRQWLLKAKGTGHMDWDAFFGLMADDTPFPHMQQLLRDLSRSYTTFIYVTGRPERYRNLTVAWLTQHDFPLPVHLYMRKDGDRRNDDIIKEELLNDIRLDGHIPIMAFDDRNRVVEMWRNNGIPCAQVAEGNF